MPVHLLCNYLAELKRWQIAQCIKNNSQSAMTHTVDVEGSLRVYLSHSRRNSSTLCSYARRGGGGKESTADLQERTEAKQRMMRATRSCQKVFGIR